ncbi:FYN-binding protein 1 isoform X2 [Hippocampus zosterae]|uniref:FYN-binding protein 1 isoform X2 n=1 Tax=Hippocampus zosterae TaxID=109293 RepID=UPI00223CE495|nr:FYN-binding protein 1 isoform X2 [Hippocampus zosterae]
MEEESQINFKALRAKFQEEALLAQTKTTRPTVAEKPKNLPPAGGHCSSVVSSINIATENKTTVVPRVIFRNELRASGGKRSTSSPAQPPQLSPSSQPINGDGRTKKQTFKERHMPQVLPVLCSKEHRFDPLIKKESPQEQELVKEVPQIKPKKNNLLLALKSSRVSKFSSESEEEPTYAELTTRPASAPGELPSVEKQTSEDGVSLQGDQLPATRRLSSPDVSVSPPLLETSVDSDNRIISTLERAKRKFSCRHILISSKSKSLRSPDFASSERPFLSSPRNVENTEPDLPPLPPPPVGLPHLACISARPFSKVNNSARKPAFLKPYRPDKAEGPSVTTDLHSHSNPQKNPLPDLRSLGPKPAKPRRPPLVSLRHDQKPVHEVLKDLSQEPIKGSESEKPTSGAVLDAPVFPDFENPETEPTQIEAVDIAALDLKVLDLGGLGSPPPAPADRGVPESKTSQSDTRTSEVASESSVAQQLKVGSLSGIPSHPASFPEPSNLTESITRDRRSPSQDVIVPPPPPPTSRADEAELAAAESRCARDETELRFQAAPTNEDTRTRASDPNYECDNVYEDVENINKFFLCQNSRKQKGNLKNPYADSNLPAKEEVPLHIWPRNPWGSISGEHSSHNLVHGKERQTPNTTADYKELKKREKQRLEKEKKEQKEREKKENEMKKKFKVTGDEEPMYHAKVMVASKVRKNDLPVKSGDTVSIIRTTNCPKGKWLARDARHKYGYISVMNVELNIKEMLELGKKAQAAGRGANPDGDTISIGSRSSSHLVVTSSFTDDSEEWACEDETLSACYASHIPHQTTSLAEAYDLASKQHTLSHANVEDLHTQKRHEALQKLAIFFEQSKDEFGDVPDSGAPTPTNPDPPSFLCAVEEPPYTEQEVDFSELGLLPPPPLYADTD